MTANTKTLVIAALLATTAAVAAVNAADIGYRGPAYAPAPVVYAPLWTGGYVGANLGYQWASSGLSSNPNGLVGGIQGGYNFQSGQLVIGGELDFQISGAEDTFAPYKFSNPWFGTVRGRLGYSLSNILLYGTLGLAYGRGEVQAFGFSERNIHTGWAAGAGIEVALAPNWSARAEYLYVDLGRENYLLPVINAGFESSILRFGLNYRF